MKPRLKRILFIAPLAILGMLVFIAIGGEVVLQLWNWLLPSLFGSRRSNFRRRMRERCEHMTPEERERFRQGIRAGWGFGPPTSESKGQ